MDNKSWDNLAANYDKSVEDNPSPLIINYLDKEIEILNILFVFCFWNIFPNASFVIKWTIIKKQNY